jgi:transposase
MMVAPPIGAINKSSAFTAMSHRNTRSWRSVGRGSRGGGSPGGLHPSSTYIGVPQLGLSPDGPAAGGDHARPCLQRVEAAGWCAYLGAMARYELTDTAWQRLEPLLPPSKPRTGRRNRDHRRILNGILWIHRTGAPWRDLSERYGPVGTVSSRFYRWRQSGVWARNLSALQAEADARGEIDWDLHFVDAAIVRAHQHAAGARRTGAIGGVRHWAGRGAGSRPRSTCAPRAMGGRSWRS